jgi:hypothetical protein
MLPGISSVFYKSVQLLLMHNQGLAGNLSSPKDFLPLQQDVSPRRDLHFV